MKLYQHAYNEGRADYAHGVELAQVANRADSLDIGPDTAGQMESFLCGFMQGLVDDIRAIKAALK